MWILCESGWVSLWKCEKVSPLNSPAQVHTFRHQTLKLAQHWPKWPKLCEKCVKVSQWAETVWQADIGHFGESQAMKKSWYFENFDLPEFRTAFIFLILQKMSFLEPSKIGQRRWLLLTRLWTTHLYSLLSISRDHNSKLRIHPPSQSSVTNQK